MKYSAFWARLFIFLFPFCISSSVYIYFYPFFHRCAFPSVSTQGNVSSGADPSAHGALAPFRLLAFGDPQLEGDTSLPAPRRQALQKLDRLKRSIKARQAANVISNIGGTVTALFTDDIPRILQSHRKRLDLLGNDYYLAHIYRTLWWWTRPTHVTVLGDLLGSQWIDDEEFARRAWRFWNRAFLHGESAGEDLTEGARSEVLGDDPSWARRIINVAGNHDVGYAGDLNKERLERFESAFGPVNWDLKFHLPNNTTTSGDDVSPDDRPEIRLVVLNSMNLDTRAQSEEIQQQTYHFVNEVIMSSRPVEDRRTFTILLTHIPLYKDAGVCVDGPFFEFYSDGGVKEQNHLSYPSAKGVLEGVYGMSSNRDRPDRGRGRNGLILTGHDHEGCDVYHSLANRSEEVEREWNATRWSDSQDIVHRDAPGIREITVRSMMGEFGGNAGLLSVWFDPQLAEWRFDYSSCAFGVQHIWWAVHIADAIALLLLLCAVVARYLESRASPVQGVQSSAGRGKRLRRKAKTS